MTNILAVALGVILGTVIALRGPIAAWWKARVRFLFQLGPAPDKPFYIRVTPNFGIGFPLPGGRRRIRFARHHGLQTTRWSGKRWRVEKQLLGRSKVKGESYLSEAR